MQQSRFCQTKLRVPAPGAWRIFPGQTQRNPGFFVPGPSAPLTAPPGSAGQNAGQLGKPCQQKIRGRRRQGVQVPIAIGDRRGEGAGLLPGSDVRNFIPHHEAAGGSHPQIGGQGQQRSRLWLQGEAFAAPPDGREKPGDVDSLQVCRVRRWSLLDRTANFFPDTSARVSGTPG